MPGPNSRERRQARRQQQREQQQQQQRASFEQMQCELQSLPLQLQERNAQLQQARSLALVLAHNPVQDGAHDDGENLVKQEPGDNPMDTT